MFDGVYSAKTVKFENYMKIYTYRFTYKICEITDRLPLHSISRWSLMHHDLDSAKTPERTCGTSRVNQTSDRLQLLYSWFLWAD